MFNYHKNVQNQTQFQPKKTKLKHTLISEFVLLSSYNGEKMLKHRETNLFTVYTFMMDYFSIVVHLCSFCVISNKYSSNYRKTLEISTVVLLQSADFQCLRTMCTHLSIGGGGES